MMVGLSQFCLPVGVLVLLQWTAPTVAGSSTFGGGRFTSQGPVLTITLPPTSSLLPTYNDDNDNKNDDPSTSILESLQPSWTYSISSSQPPLPHWFPALKSIGASLGYQYPSKSGTSSSSIASYVLPSYWEGVAKIENSALNVQIQPSHDWKKRLSTLIVQAARGSKYSAQAKFTTTTTPAVTESSSSTTTSSTSSKKAFWRVPRPSAPTAFGLDTIRASGLWSLPLASLASIRVSPSLHFGRSNKKSSKLPCDMACQLEAVTGGAGKTVATLSVHTRNNPTLAIQYQPDAYNWIKPVIDLYTGHVSYQWIVAFPQQTGSVHTVVDPSSAITVTWTDHSSTPGSTTSSRGTWVTDVRIPLAGKQTTLRSLAADIRVRRQFRF